MADQEVLESPESTVAAGRALAAALLATGPERAVIYLRGDLGAGKTTFARGFLSGFGHTGRVPSPTYTLVEPYEFERYIVYHVDLYRLGDPGEVDELGLADLAGPGVIWLIEWPERAGDRLEAADLEITLELVPDGRRLRREALTRTGECLLAHKYV